MVAYSELADARLDAVHFLLNGRRVRISEVGGKPSIESHSMYIGCSQQVSIEHLLIYSAISLNLRKRQRRP